MHRNSSLMKKYAYLFSFLLLASCEKVINIDLNNATPRLVIQGNITDAPGLLSHHVLLSQTTDFSANGNTNPVTGAVVVVTDSTLNISDTLLETSPGDYVTQNILGISGHRYLLFVQSAGKSYTASSQMPEVIPFDSLYNQKLNIFGNDVNQFVPVFQDPAGVKNFYRFTIQINDSLQNDVEAWDDKLTDGKLNSRPITIGNSDLFRGDDTVIIQMRCIDEGAYNFFNTFYNATGDAQTPANPTSNISNGALGYFSAYTARNRTIIVP